MSQRSKHHVASTRSRTMFRPRQESSMLKLVQGRNTTKTDSAAWGRLLEKARILAWEADAQSWRFTYVSEQAEKMLGYPIEEWYEPNFLAAHLHPDDRHIVFPADEKRSIGSDRDDLKFRMLSIDGRVVWLSRLVNATSGAGNNERISGLLIDISERKNAEQALTELGGRLIAAQEKERGRIARELHDDFNQRMALLSIELEQLGEGIHEPVDYQLFKKLQRQVKEISADIHRLSYRLHPSKLDHLGLDSAVKSLCEEFSRNAKLRIGFHKTGFPSALPRDLALNLFRIAQEALRNCVKHSGAQSVQVVLVRSKNAVRLSVSDNGCGFDTKAEMPQSGLGFISMRERLHLIGGEMQIHSQPRRGTRIEVSVPLLRESPRQFN